MNNPIDEIGVRVLGSLIEKEITTPDNYPLTLNALVVACNQSTNRDPVMALDEPTVASSLDDLAKRSLARGVLRNDSRVKRYRQSMSETLKLHAEETAVMCVLMLRGAQTAGEVRTRAARLFEFRDVPHVEVTLQSLMTMSEPLVAQLPRGAGQKEVRYAHLLSGEPDVQAYEAVAHAPMSGSKADRVEALEHAVDSLRAEMAELRSQLEEFRKEFQ